MTTIFTKYTYGEKSGRLGLIEHKIDTHAWYAVTNINYDALGRVRFKKVGGLAEVQNYTYNVNGQLIGINLAQLNDTAIINDSMTYWSEICYATGFDSARFDGMITGYKWRSASSKVSAYGYNFDKSKRMISADYNDYSFANRKNQWNHVNRDFSVANLSYDASGNILSMSQRGYDNSMLPATIDSLIYTYDDGNKLTKVVDYGVASPIRDFDNGNTADNTDYGYDADGNLMFDLNKGIDSIVYNHLGLTTKVLNATGESIENTFDGSGKLLRKVVSENGSTVIYRYFGPYVYRNDSLQYVMHGEGRVRWYPDSVEYDFFVKDHLGNVRTVVNSQVTYDTTGYFAGWELISASVEESFFDYIGEIRDLKPLGSPNDLMSGWLDGSDPSKQIGAAIMLHGMAGDQFTVGMYGFYEDTSTANMNTYALPSQMFNSLLGVLTGSVVQGTEGGDNIQIVNNLMTPQNYDLYETLKQQVTDPNYPRAYLNYMVFDELFNLKQEYSQVIQLKGPANTWNKMELPQVFQMPVNGYILVYASNESDMVIALDNSYAVHYKGRLLEEQLYYPHGLVVRGGSSMSIANKYLTQGNQIQEEVGLELFDFNFRNYDQQIGRFTAIDKLADYLNQERITPYHFCGNNPGIYTDPLGLGIKDNNVLPEVTIYPRSPITWDEVAREEFPLPPSFIKFFLVGPQKAGAEVEVEALENMDT